MYGEIRNVLARELDDIRAQGLYKEERVLEGPQGAEVRSAGARS